jgi:ribonuclease HI
VIVEPTGEEKEYSDLLHNHSINYVELFAIAYGLRQIPDGKTVKVYSDSEYAIDVLNRIVNERNSTRVRRMTSSFFMELKHRVDGLTIFIEKVNRPSPALHRRAHHLARKAAGVNYKWT